MPRGVKLQLQQSQGSDDSGFMTAMAQQVQTSWENKKRESETSFLQAAKLELDQCGTLRAKQFAAAAKEMDVIFEHFVMDYAAADDCIRAKWQELLAAQMNCLEFSRAKHPLLIETDQAREKGQVRGMAVSKKAMTDGKQMIDSLESVQNE